MLISPNFKLNPSAVFVATPTRTFSTEPSARPTATVTGYVSLIQAGKAVAPGEVNQRSEGAVKLYLVAFDVDAEKFGFVSDVRGTVLEAHNAVALRASLDTLYRGHILAEAVDASETQAARPDSSNKLNPTHRPPPPGTPPRPR